MAHFCSKISFPRATAAASPLAEFFVCFFAGGASCAKTVPATASAVVPRIRRLRFTIPPGRAYLYWSCEFVVELELECFHFHFPCLPRGIPLWTRHKGQVAT